MFLGTFFLFFASYTPCWFGWVFCVHSVLYIYIYIHCVYTIGIQWYKITTRKGFEGKSVLQFYESRQNLHWTKLKPHYIKQNKEHYKREEVRKMEYKANFYQQ